MTAEIRESVVGAVMEDDEVSMGIVSFVSTAGEDSLGASGTFSTVALTA